MLPGFPKTVTVKKIRRGHYRISREDGEVVEVQRGVHEWFVGNGGRTVKRLSTAIYDLKHGYTALDQLRARIPGYE